MQQPNDMRRIDVVRSANEGDLSEPFATVRDHFFVAPDTSDEDVEELTRLFLENHPLLNDPDFL